jgi:protoporphyrinogen oxidase
MRPSVLVVGGGPCGLAAALGAARAGRSVELLEAAPRLGGMAASITVGGQRVDLGSHRLHPSAEPRVRALLDELLGADLQERRRNGRLHLAGRWVAFPLRPADLVRSVPVGVGARIATDVVTGPLRGPRDGSYAEFVRAGLGPTALAMFHGPMATKLWGCDPSGLSADLARRRIAVNGGSRLLRRIARGARPAGRTFLYPRLGYGEVVDRLAGSAVVAGARIETGRRVDVLEPGRPVRVTLDDGRRINPDRVLWTAPLDGLVGVVAGAPDVAPPGHRGVVLVYLVLEEDCYSDFDAHYVPDPDVAFARLSEPKNYRDGPDPAGRTVLCAEVPATVGDACWASSDAALAQIVLDGMDRLGLRRPAVAGVEVVRLPRVYPVIAVDDDARLRALAWADGLDGISVLGRQGLAVADNLHHVMDMALGAVECLGPDGWDEARWQAERARFDTFVVDD